MTSRRYSPESEIGDTSDYRRNSPDRGDLAGAGSPGDGGLLDSFNAEFAADPGEKWLDASNSFGGGPKVPTIDQEQAEHARQNMRLQYKNAGQVLPAENASNFALERWQFLSGNANAGQLPEAVRDEAPSDQLSMVNRYGERLGRMRARSIRPAYQEPGDVNDRGMLDRFDAEFNSGAALKDDNMDDDDIAELNRERKRVLINDDMPFGPDAPRRGSNYMEWGKKPVAIPEIAPMAREEEMAKRAKDISTEYKNSHYLDNDGRPMKPSDPRARGRGQEPPPKKRGLFSRMGSGISNWWKASRLNWSNWGRNRRGQ